MRRLRTKYTGFYHVLDDQLRRAYMMVNRMLNTDQNMLGVSVCT